jgi:RNA polymerase sigma factor (sigma-70 family)
MSALCPGSRLVVASGLPDDDHYDVQTRWKVTSDPCYLTGARCVLVVTLQLTPERTVIEEERLAAEFETHRSYLHTIAFRILGSDADADDSVQEAWLRLARAGGESIEDLRGWLTTVTGRICLDVLRRRGRRGEQPLELGIGLVPQEPADVSGVGPEEHALLADSVSLALYVVMDALNPAERVSFVLHDVFDIPFDSIAAILGRSTAATKMLASRARGRIRLGAPAMAADAAAREVVEAFLAAAGRGDFEKLLTVLAPDAELWSHAHGSTTVAHGPREIASRAKVGARQGARVYPAVVDGGVGVLITMDGRPTTVMSFTITDGLITAIRTLYDPERLAQVVPSWVA